MAEYLFSYRRLQARLLIPFVFWRVQLINMESKFSGFPSLWRVQRGGLCSSRESERVLEFEGPVCSEVDLAKALVEVEI